MKAGSVNCSVYEYRLYWFKCHITRKWYVGEEKCIQLLLGNVKGRAVWETWHGVDWIDLAQDRDRWRAVVNMIMYRLVSWNAGNCVITKQLLAPQEGPSCVEVVITRKFYGLYRIFRMLTSYFLVTFRADYDRQIRPTTEFRILVSS